MTQSYIEEILYMNFIEYIGFEQIEDYDVIFFNYISAMTVSKFKDKFSIVTYKINF